MSDTVRAANFAKIVQIAACGVDNNITTQADTCKHFDPMPDEPDFGECLWAEPVPIWITNAERHVSMMASDGKNCQTWKEKE